MKQNISWDDLTDTPKSEGGGLLGSIPPEVTRGGHVEFTLAYPQIDAFCNATSDKQKKLYTKLFNDTLSAIAPEYKAYALHVFEFFKTGHIHMHGVLKLTNDKPFFLIGLIADLAKKWHSLMPVKKYQRYHVYNGKHLYSDLNRYKAPSICIQYYYDGQTIAGESALVRWIQYMNKCQMTPLQIPLTDNQKDK